MRNWIALIAAGALLACSNNADSAGDDTTATAVNSGGTPSATGSSDEPEQIPDLLTLAEGAVLVSASANDARAIDLSDGSNKSTWNTNIPKSQFPFTFVFELRAPTEVRRVGVAGAGPRPGGVVGGSAKAILVEGSAEGPNSGFRTLAEFDAKEDGVTLIEAESGNPVRWVRYSLKSTHGSDQWIYLGEAILEGEQIPPDNAEKFAGVFDMGRKAFLDIKRDGNSLSGCYVENGGLGGGTFIGQVGNGVARLDMTTDEGVKYAAFLVIDSKDALSGVRYRQRSRSAWSGPRAPEDSETPCSKVEQPANPVADALDKQGEVILYGILFDFDKATLKPESRAALKQLKDALDGDPSLKLTIEGHTDSDGDDQYNRDLSQKRAEAVVAWLSNKGVDGSRLTPAGKGEGEPVASNDTAEGRALNRRVEATKE